MRLTMMASALLATACTTMPGEPVIVPAPTGECKAEAAQVLVGRQATTELGAEAQRLTGGRGIRWIQPGQAVTMDFRPDRINIKLDAQNRVTGITCG